MTRRAVIYCRISRDPSQAGLGVKRQEREVRALAERLGYEVVAVYADNDRSAYSGKPRPEYDRMIAALDDVDALLVWAVDRLTRQPKELEALIDRIEEANVEIHTVTNGELDLATSSGRLSARVVGAVARAESEQKSARIRSKHAELLRDGKSAGGGRAFGFLPGNAVVDEFGIDDRAPEAPVLRELVERLLDGTATIMGLANELNDREILTPRGKRWTATVLRGVLSNPRIAGIRTTTERTKGGRRGARREVRDATWKGIVSVDDFRRVEALLAGRRRAGGLEPRLLTGLLVCDLCGAKLVGSRRNAAQGGFPIYTCARQSGDLRGCRRNSIRADLLERRLVPIFLDYARTRYEAPTKTVDVSDAEDELARVAARKVELGTKLADDELDPDVYAAAIVRLDERKRTAEETIRRSAAEDVDARTAATIGNLHEVWEDPDFGPARQRAALALFVEEVRIAGFKPGKGFDDSRIGEPTYR